jgi:hypothetical protein
MTDHRLIVTDCSEMDELPGVRLLSSGFDPLAAPKQPCQFDDCRTTQLFQFTYTHGYGTDDDDDVYWH